MTNQLANLNQLFNYICEDGQHPVRIAGTFEKPLFCAKDVCSILGIEKYRDAVGRLDSDQGCPVILDTLGGKQRVIFINEAGLYELIFASRKPVAKQFRRWVFSEVLPEIRKRGSYQLQQQLEETKQEAEYARLEAEMAQQHEQQAKVELERAQQLEQKAREELESIRTRELRLQDFVRSTTRLEKTEIFYIGTTSAYQRQNRFKLGGCSSLASLKGRFSSYNTGRASGDDFFCARYWQVHSYTLTEKQAKTYLKYFRDHQMGDKEMYHIHGTALEEAIEFIIQHAGESEEFFNQHFEDFTSKTINATPREFEPISFREQLCITAGAHRVEVADITNWSEDKVKSAVQEILDIYKARRRLESLDGHTADWKDVSEIVRELYKGSRMLEWRQLLKRHGQVAIKVGYKKP